MIPFATFICGLLLGLLYGACLTLMKYDAGNGRQVMPVSPQRYRLHQLVSQHMPALDEALGSVRFKEAVERIAAEVGHQIDPHARHEDALRGVADAVERKYEDQA